MGNRAWDLMNNYLEPAYQRILRQGGYDPDYKQRYQTELGENMRSAQMGAEENIDREVSALGMQNTGLGLREKRALNSDVLNELSSGQRRVELDSKNWLRQAMMGMQGLAESEALINNAESKTGFWGTLGRGLAGGLAKSIFG